MIKTKPLQASHFMQFCEQKFAHNKFALSIFCGVTGVIGVIQGADASFDTLNYHLFNGWIGFNPQVDRFLPTSIWSFFPNGFDAIYSFLWVYLPSVYVTFFFAAFHGLVGLIVFQFMRDMMAATRFNSLLAYTCGFLVIMNPLFRSQLGSSMQDTTLAVLEALAIVHFFRFRYFSARLNYKLVALLLGIVVATKPSHFAAAFVGSLLVLSAIDNYSRLKYVMIIGVTGVALNLMTFISSFQAVKSPFFPYIDSNGSGEYLSNLPTLTHSYPEWLISSPWDFLKTLFFPGGSFQLNSQIPYLDFTIPFGFFLVLIWVFFRLVNSHEIKKNLPAWVEIYLVGILILTINLFVFTGNRYAMVSNVLVIISIALSFQEMKRLKALYPLFTYLTITLIVMARPLITDSDFQIKALPMPDWGRTEVTFRNALPTLYPKPEYVSKKAIVILGQEQVSFVGPLWNDKSLHFVGLQAYILGPKSRDEIQSRFNEAIQSKVSVVLVSLTYNLSTMNSQLKTIDKNLELSNCKTLANPFEREISVCSVSRAQA